MRIVRVSSCLVRAAAAALCLSVPLPAAGQEPATGAAQVVSQAIAVSAASLRGDLPEPRVPHASLQQRRQSLFPVVAPDRPERPRALLPLYGSLIALQGLDIHSTRSAIGSGSATEANPAMRPIVRHSAAFVAVKAGATAGVIWASEKLWKKNRKAALIFASVINAGMAAVVANNYRVSR